ncbi:MAG: hypothetical protein EBT92_09955 [Planctomycetes bacterium]|nr:hypothetical protein [Planctomycetota bacterium]NBY02442.1 hypothetical protein [Planctomycetota bacterium]
MALDKLYPIVIYTLYISLKIESMVIVHSSWKSVINNIEKTLNDSLLKIGDTGAELNGLVKEEVEHSKNIVFQQTIQNNLGKIEIALNKTNSQFNILTMEMESAADVLRIWIGKAKQCQEKIKSIK